MKFLLKIVQGPNAGAEIALVEGVRVTLGSADSCDIVLADPTLAAEACAIEVSEDSVILTPSGAGAETLEPLHVRSFGSTAMAVGPADTPWGPLEWPPPARSEDTERVAGETRTERTPEPSDPGDSSDSSGSSAPGASSASEAVSGESAASPRGRLRRVGCLVGILVILILLAFAAWKFLPRLSPSDTPTDGEAVSVPEAAVSDIPDFAVRYGIAIVETNGILHARGDFATRAERLAATAALYEAHPGIKLDFADRDTLLSSVADLLAAATDGVLEVRDVTNRVAVLAGRIADMAALRTALDALRTDVPRLSGIDAAAVTVESPFSAPSIQSPTENPPVARQGTSTVRRAPPRLPLCGILLQPYPCLVLQDGRRLAVGSELSGYKIVSIAADRIKVRSGEEEELEWTP